MVRIPESRAKRREQARREALALAMTPRLPKELQIPGRPKYGVAPTSEQQRASERQKLIEKHGERANERQADRRGGDRRVRSMTPQEMEDWLKLNPGGDRRVGERRTGDRRK